MPKEVLGEPEIAGLGTQAVIFTIARAFSDVSLNDASI